MPIYLKLLGRIVVAPCWCFEEGKAHGKPRMILAGCKAGLHDDHPRYCGRMGESSLRSACDDVLAQLAPFVVSECVRQSVCPW